jgi:hypothetical protein
LKTDPRTRLSPKESWSSPKRRKATLTSNYHRIGLPQLPQVFFGIPDELPIAQDDMRFIFFIVKRLNLIFARVSTDSIYATNPAAKYDYSNLE